MSPFWPSQCQGMHNSASNLWNFQIDKQLGSEWLRCIGRWWGSPGLRCRLLAGDGDRLAWERPASPLLRSMPPEIPSQEISPIIASAFTSISVNSGTVLGPAPVRSRSLSTVALRFFTLLAKSFHFLRTSCQSLCAETEAAIIRAIPAHSSCLNQLDTVAGKAENSVILFRPTSSSITSVSSSE